MSTNRFKITLNYEIPFFREDTRLRCGTGTGKCTFFAEKEPTSAQAKKLIAENVRPIAPAGRMFFDDDIKISDISVENIHVKIPADPPSRSFSDVLAIISCLISTALAVYCITKNLYQ